MIRRASANGIMLHFGTAEWGALITGLVAVVASIIGSAVGVTVFYFRDSAALKNELVQKIDTNNSQFMALQQESSKNFTTLNEKVTAIAAVAQKFDASREQAAAQGQLLQDVRDRVGRIESKLE